MYSFSRYGVDFKIVEQEDPALQKFWSYYYPNWESDTYQTILPHLDIEKTFVDIGAWQGPISLIAQKYSNQCICLEPDPIAYEYLLKNIEINNIKNIIPLELALSNEDELYIGNDELGGSGTSYLRPQNAVRCETISFKELLQQFNLNEQNISLIKMDVEGYEYEVLKDETFKNINVPKHISLHGEYIPDKNGFIQIVRDFAGPNVQFNINGLDSIFLDKK